MIKTMLMGIILATWSGCGIEPEAERKQLRQGTIDENLDALPRLPDQRNPGEFKDPEDNDQNQDAPESSEEPAPIDTPVELPAPESNWHSLFFTGDNSIWAFDNAREELSGMFEGVGFAQERMHQLTMMGSLINQGMDKTSHNSITGKLKDFEMTDNDLCLVHMTSHGSRSGFYLKGQNQLTPSQFDKMLDDSCGDRGTVVLVSACYSGIFTASRAMQKDNRIILTAAREDRTSFGCSPENEYTYWDGCLIDHLPSSESWLDLYENVNACIQRKEGGGGFTPSLPQFFAGEKSDSIPYPFN